MYLVPKKYFNICNVPVLIKNFDLLAMFYLINLFSKQRVSS